MGAPGKRPSQAQSGLCPAASTCGNSQQPSPALSAPGSCLPAHFSNLLMESVLEWAPAAHGWRGGSGRALSNRVPRDRSPGCLERRGAVSPSCRQPEAVLKMTVLSPVGAGGEASLWPDPRRELEAESLPRRRAEPLSPLFQPPEVGGPAGLGSWKGGAAPPPGTDAQQGAHPPAGEGAWGVGETGAGVSRGVIFEGPGSHLLLSWGTTVPGWARLHKE